jgi:hypothetical protein
MRDDIKPTELILINKARELDSSWWPDDLERAELVKDNDDPPEMPDALWCLRVDVGICMEDSESEGEEWKHSQVIEYGETVPLDDRILEASCPLTDSQAARIIRDALHSRVLELGAVVHASGTGYFTVRVNNLVVVGAPSLISAMCQYIIKVAEE